MYDICTIWKNTQYVPDIYIYNICFFIFILHISGTDRCKIGVRYIIFWPVSDNTYVKFIWIISSLLDIEPVYF
jgi:hypothetical protein